MMSKVFDTVALGETLIDFTEHGVSEQGNPIFEANPGGAPCNVLAMLRNLGKTCAFIGKVGDDIFGRELKAITAGAGIDTQALIEDADVRTTLAFVKTLEGGDRDFSFYRNPGADMMLTEDELPEDMIRNARIFHIGSLSMTHDGIRRATRKAVALAKDGGALISFDPNLRPPLWEKEEDALEQIEWGLAHCDILKIADNEIEFVTGKTDFDAGAAVLQEKYPGIRLLNVTAGAEGSYSYYRDMKAFEPASTLGGVIETTGAGDTFCGCVLNYVLENGIDDLKEEQLHEMLRFANTAAYLVTTKKGAFRSMPTRSEVEELIG